jgi:hypothetical protein
MVLGSGLGPIADAVQDATVIPYCDIPHFHAPGVQGHPGRLVIGHFNGVPALVLQVGLSLGYGSGQVAGESRQRLMGLHSQQASVFVTLVMTGRARQREPAMSTLVGCYLWVRHHLQ